MRATKLEKAYIELIRRTRDIRQTHYDAEIRAIEDYLDFLEADKS